MEAERYMRTGRPWLTRPATVTFLVILLGLGLRAYHYLRAPEIWHDEAALVVNVLDKNFAELLGPLRFHEAGPPLFLWLEKAVTLAFGDSLYALRLPSFLASCAALLLLVPLSRRLLVPEARPWALLLFACSEQLAWHACEAKPYSVDVLVATVVLWIGTCDEAPLARRLAMATFVAPFFIALSYPACFVFGGLLTALLPAVWAERRGKTWLVYCSLAATVAVTFLWVLLGPGRAQRDPELMSCWTNCFADWSKPWTAPGWAFLSTLEVSRYCFKPFGQPLILLALVAGFVSVRTGKSAQLILLALPIGLALFAACLHLYPYGGVRVMAYAAPALALLTASGIISVAERLAGYGNLPRSLLAGLLLLPLLVSLQRIALPWDRPDTTTALNLIEKQRQPGERVMGNDWTHSYICRRLGNDFIGPDLPHPATDDRYWILFTDLCPHAERVSQACRMLPGNWKIISTVESHWTSGVLLVRDEYRDGAAEHE